MPRLGIDSNNTISIIFNVWSSESKASKTYVVLFGNKEHGYECELEDLPYLWSRCIRWAKYTSFGDVTLVKNDKCIRAMHNAERRILDKTSNYPYHVNKYND